MEKNNPPRMNLTVDVGNTHLKAAVFENGQLVETFKTRESGTDLINNICRKYPAIGAAIIVSVREQEEGLKELLSCRFDPFIDFDASVRVPIENLYKSPETLGYDRLAAAVGANAIYPESNVLIVDFGTAVTFDLVNAGGQFIGGNISPGAETRLRALNRDTGKLPLVELQDTDLLLGADTREAILAGIVNGMTFELEGYVRTLSEIYPDLKVIFTGGDGKFFANRLKNTIFATYDLVVYGLNRILEYNAN